MKCIDPLKIDPIEKVREIVYEVGGQTIMNFINQVTKDGGTKYVLWHNKSTSFLLKM
jgi:hypothetical protein